MGFSATADEGFAFVDLVDGYVSNDDNGSLSTVSGNPVLDLCISSSLDTGLMLRNLVTPGSSSRVRADVGEQDENESSSSSCVFSRNNFIPILALLRNKASLSTAASWEGFQPVSLLSPAV